MDMIDIPNINEIIIEIEKLRSSMLAIGKQKGLNDPETIHASQELDKLIYTVELISLNSFELL
jgi:hypothetical protein